jgi:chemotaxis protein histidine kinase CheA
MKGTMTVRDFVRALAILVVSLTFAAGCNLLASDQDQAIEKQKQKNEKLQKQLEEEQQQKAREEKKEEEERQKELEQKVEDLQKKVDSQDEKNSQEEASQPTESRQPDQAQPQQAEEQAAEQARAAAEAYYEAVAVRNWGYTYDHLDSETQSTYTEQEWFSKNDYLADTGAVTYTIHSVVMDSSAPETFAYVSVVLTATDGSTNVRDTYFVYEDGSWLHRFSPEEYDLLASAPTGSSSATPSASASASANPYGCPDDRPYPATAAGDPGEGSLQCFATQEEAAAYSGEDLTIEGCPHMHVRLPSGECVPVSDPRLDDASPSASPTASPSP